MTEKKTRTERDEVVNEIIDQSGRMVRVAPLDAALPTSFSVRDVVSNLDLTGDAEKLMSWSRARKLYTGVARLRDGRWVFIKGMVVQEQVDVDRLPEWEVYGSSVAALNPDLLIAVVPEGIRVKVRSWIKSNSPTG